MEANQNCSKEGLPRMFGRQRYATLFFELGALSYGELKGSLSRFLAAQVTVWQPL